ncbi:hypothetical protein LLH00_12635 [bacterium]|nr:hypothetical protein [bacterium]
MWVRACCAWLLFSCSLLSAAVDRRIAVEWRDGQPQGQILVTKGSLDSLCIMRGKGALKGAGGFKATAAGPFRIEALVRGCDDSYGQAATIVTVKTADNPFSFFLRDASTDQPVYIPEYGVVVTEASDRRSYTEIETAIKARGGLSKLERLAAEPEECFDSAAANTRSLTCQTWLGLSRDIRLFSIGDRLEWIQPRFHGDEVALPENGDQPCRYKFLLGRGWGPVSRITRRLEDGVLPILHGALIDDDITYNLTAFVSLESSTLTGENLRGTHYLVADGFGAGHMFTPEQQARYDALAPEEMNRPEETVLFMRIEAANAASVPRYAFFRNPAPGPADDFSFATVAPYTFDGAEGLGVFESGRVFAVSTLDGKPLRQEQAAVEVRPGGSAVLEVRLLHRPVSRERALKLREASFEQRHAECRAFWQHKLDSAARIHVPEPRIDKMLRAGLLHLDLITYGLEPDSTLTATIGVYSAIGSESSPIIQFMDAMGWHETARRALTYFLDKQHDDGFMQNFGGYMLETGAALWSLGEHYRYTRDDDWVRRIEPKLVKACEYLHAWRERNMNDSLRGRGYGMLEGKVADPNDPFHSFMLNGYAYLGLARVAEMLAAVDPKESARWSREAEALKADIRTTFFESMGRSPVIPLGGGAWCPTAPPWPEHQGPLGLFTDGGRWFSHGAMQIRDALGPLYLVYQEVLAPEETASTFLVNFNSEMMTSRNTAFSQPYYSRHPVVHLLRGEVRPFLKAYYNTVASLADRQTYTFWEHYFGASPHKTHEEGWFMMQTRWMLCLEKGTGIKLLPGVPRAWLDRGKRIDLERVATYFGPLSLHVESAADRDAVHAEVDCSGARRPGFVELRLPHPQGRKALRVTGGVYDPQTETVRIEPFSGRAEVSAEF